MRDFSGFPSVEVLTLQDMVYTLSMRCGVVTSNAQSDARVIKAIQSAIKSLHAKHRWAYYRRQTRLRTSPQLSLTITYDHTGGAEERLVTITAGGVWPSDATYGDLMIGDTSYRILKRISDTQATLEQDFSIGADYTGSAVWARRAYRLTRNILRVDSVYNVSTSRYLVQAPTGDVPALATGEHSSPRYFSWQNHGNQFGASELVLYPSPFAAEDIEVFAAVLPIHPTIHSVTGADLAGTSSTTAVTSASGAFSSKLIGSILRVSDNASAPVKADSANYAFQAFIVGVPSATSLTLSEPLPATYSGRGYLISSPIDIETSVMQEALEDEAFYQYTKNHNHQGLKDAAAVSQKSLREAMARDNKSGENTYADDSLWFNPIGALDLLLED